MGIVTELCVGPIVTAVTSGNVDVVGVWVKLDNVLVSTVVETVVVFGVVVVGILLKLGVVAVS